VAAFLGAIGQSQQNGRCISEMPGLHPNVAGALRRNGYGFYVEDAGTLAEMSGRAAAASLDESGLRPDEVDYVLLSTESFTDPARSQDEQSRTSVRNELLDMLSDRLGLHRSVVVGTWMSGCGNLAPAVKLAEGLVRARSARNVLVIAADQLFAEQTRAANDGSILFSDLATACVVSTSPSAFELVGAHLEFTAPILQARLQGNSLRRIRALRGALLRLDEQVRQATGWALRDLDLVVLDSFGDDLIDTVCHVTGARRDRMRVPAREPFGHAYASDLLLSLRMLHQSGELPRGSRIAAVSVAAWTLAAIILRAT